MRTQELRRLLPISPVWLKDRDWCLRVMALERCGTFYGFSKYKGKRRRIDWWVTQARRKRFSDETLQRICEGISRTALGSQSMPNLFILVVQKEEGWMVLDGNHRLMGALLHPPKHLKFVGVFYGFDR